MNRRLIIAGILVVLPALLTLAAADSIAEWSVAKKTYFVSKSHLPAGAEVRVKVAVVGDSGIVSVEEYVGSGFLVSKSIKKWSGVARQQVLTVKTPNKMKIGIQTGAENGEKKALSVTEKDGYHVMTFKDGWVLHVKVVGKDS